MDSIIRFATSGGDGGGKSTALEKLALKYPDTVQLVPEMASALMNGALPKLGTEVSITPEVIFAFQRVARVGQLSSEQLWALVAKEHGRTVLACDRGAGDLAAYSPGGWSEVEDALGQDKEALLSRYKKVIYLRSLAVTNPQLYLQVMSSNPSRIRRSVPEAVALCDATLKAWRDHSNLVVINGAASMEELFALFEEQVPGLTRGA